MARLTFVLDTNVIADLMNNRASVIAQSVAMTSAKHHLCLCLPVYYEVLRGLLKVNATQKLRVFHQQIIPYLDWTPLADDDWTQAAHYWSEATIIGRQLSDADLLLAAVTTRLGGIIVSADQDFSALSIRQENWRNK